MPNVFFTDEELQLIKESVEMRTDHEADTRYDNVSAINLYPRTGEPVDFLTPEKAKQLRDELDVAIRREVLRRKLCDKLGIKLNKDGFVAAENS